MSDETARLFRRDFILRMMTLVLLGCAPAWASPNASFATRLGGPLFLAGESEISLDDAVDTPTPTLVVLNTVTSSEDLFSIPEASAAKAEPTATDTPTPEAVRPKAPVPVKQKKIKLVPAATATPEPPVATPTPTAPQAAQAEATFTPPAVESTAAAVAEEKATGDKNVAFNSNAKRSGLSPEWFNYLIQAGYLVPSGSSVPQVGTIVDSANHDDILVTGMHVVIKSKVKEAVRVGDRLVVYRTLDPCVDPETGRSLGIFVRNLGVLRVTRVDGSDIQADVVGVFAPFYAKDLVKSYDDELERWKQSRRRRPLPSDAVECTVAGVANGMNRALMNETVILNAGEDQGVVAGMDLVLKKGVESAVGKKTWSNAGKLRVFFVGGKYSMAKVVWCQEPVVKGYRALYQP